MNLAVVLPVVAGLVLLRFLRVSLFVWVIAWWLALFLSLRWGFATPIPRSAIEMYMGIATVSLVAYVLSSRDRWQSFLGPVLKVVLVRRFRFVLVAVVVATPALAAWAVYRNLNVPVQPPYFARTVHPSPPATIEVHGEEVDLIRADNPFRHLEKSDPQAFREHVDNGRRVYYENCFYCHGDGLAGDGMFAHGLNPIPTDFTDAGVLPNFQESFFFWRIAKGGPGLPEEGGPWSSAMPRWETFLTTEEIWEVILFLYEFTGYQPRARGEHGHEE